MTKILKRAGMLTFVSAKSAAIAVSATAGLGFQINGIASNAEPGLISQIIIADNRAALFNTSGNRSSPPGCATVPSRFAINGGTAQGKAQLAALLLAYAQGKRIYLAESGTCSIWPDTESVSYLQVVD